MKENSDGSILRGISLFGGVQVFQILINLVRGKFVAMFLGADGMGISSIFTNSFNTIVRGSSLGLNLAIVREAAERREEVGRMKELLAVVGRLITLTALGGALLCVLFSGLLSRLSFGSDDYAWQFILLAVAVYFSVSGAGKLSLLQGMHEVKRVAGASLVGALTGLCAGVPLYYFWGAKGIVPAIVILSVATYIFYSFNLRRAVKIPKPEIRLKDHKPLIKKLVCLGLVLLSGDLIGSVCNYAINIYLRVFGDLDTVGFYQAANSLTNQYAGMVFTAMSLDYFPRLAASIGDNSRMTGIVNRQMEVVAIVMAPIACIVITTAPIIINVLLTESFQSISPLMRWMGLGIVFRALHYPMGYIAFAKDNRRLFFWMEAVLENALFLIGVILFYHFFGFIGLGYAFIVDNILTFIIYAIVNHKVYGYTIDNKTLLHGLICVSLTVACFSSSLIGHNLLSLSLMISFSLIALIYSLLTIRSRLKK